MDLLSMLLNAGNGDAVRKLAQSHGLSEDQASSAITNLLPALGQGLARNVGQPGGLDGLLGALTSGSHQRYIDNPETLGSDETIQDGNGILGHILGSKDASRQAARNAAAQTGIDEGILKKMLPAVAAMAMGALSKQHAPAGTGAAGGASGSAGLMGLLSQFLGTGQDNSMIGNVLGMASKLFNK